MKFNNGAIICGVPLSQFPIPPDDQPGCEKAICPNCSSDIWLSEMKRTIINFSNLLKIPYNLFCYNCFKDELEKLRIENPEMFEKILNLLKNNTLRIY